MNTIEEILQQLQANNDYQIFVEKILAVASCNFSPSASPSAHSWAPAVSSEDFTSSPNNNNYHHQSQDPHSGYRNCELAFKALQTFEQNIFPQSDGSESIYMTKIQDELPIHQRFMEILTFVSPEQQQQHQHLEESSTNGDTSSFVQLPTIERKIYNLTSQLFARINSIEIKKYHLNAAADAQWMTPASSRQRGSHWATIFADLLGLIETDTYPVRMKKLWLSLFHRCCAFIRSNYFTDADRFVNMLRCVGFAHAQLAVTAIGVLSAAIEDCAFVDASGKFPKYQSLGEDILNALDRAVDSGDSVTVQEICDRLDDEVDDRCVIGDIFVISVPGNSSSGSNNHHVDSNNNNDNDNNDKFTPASKKQKLLNASSINQHRLIEKFFSIVRDKILCVSSDENSKPLTPSCKIVVTAALKKMIISLGTYSCYFKNLPPTNNNNNNNNNGSGNKKKKSSKNNSEKEIPDRSVEMFNWLSDILIQNIEDREKMPDRISREQEPNNNNLNGNGNDENIQLQTSLISSSVNYKTELFVYLTQTIDTLAQTTGGSANLPLGNAVAAFVFANAASANWQNKVASFRVILHCAEAFRKLYKPQLPVLIEHLLIPRLDDENENFWVRATACSALSQLSHDFDVIHVCRPYNVALIEKFVRFARSSGDAEVVKNIGFFVGSMIDRLETSLEDEDLEDLVFAKNEEEEQEDKTKDDEEEESSSDSDDADDEDDTDNNKSQEKKNASSVRARVFFERHIRDQYLHLVPIVLENFKPLIEYYLAIFKAGEGAIVEGNEHDQQQLRQKAEDADLVLQKLCGSISTLSQVLTYKIAPWVKEIAEISLPLLAIRTSAPTTPANGAFFPFMAFEVLTMMASYCCKKDLDVLVLDDNNNNNTQKGEPQLVQIIMNFMKMHTSCPEFYIINEMYIENTTTTTSSIIKALEKRKEVASHSDILRTSHLFERTQSKAVGAILRGCTCMSEHLHTPSRLEPYLCIMVPFITSVGTRLPKQLRCRFEPGTTSGLPECDDRFDYFLEIDNEDGTEYIIKKDEGTWRNVLVASRCVAAILQTSQEGLRNMLIPFIDELTEMQDYLIRSQDEELATSALWAMGQLVSVLNVMEEKEEKKNQTASNDDQNQTALATTVSEISQNAADLPALRKRVAAKMALAAAYSIDFSGDSDTINEALSTLQNVVPHLDVSALYKPASLVSATTPTLPNINESETTNNSQEATAPATNENQQEQPEDPKLTHPVYKIYEQLDALFEMYLHFLSTGGRYDDDEDDEDEEEEEDEGDDDDDDEDEGQVFGKHFNSLKKKKSSSFAEDDENEEDDGDDQDGNEENENGENPFDEIVDRQDDDEQKSDRISTLHYYSGVACDATAVFNELVKIYPPIVLELAKETWPGAVRFLKENKISEELIVLNKTNNDEDEDDDEESQTKKKKNNKKSSSSKKNKSEGDDDENKPEYYKFQQTESAHGCWYILFSPFEQGVFNNSNPEVKNAAMSFINAKVKVTEALPLAVQGLESVRHVPHMLQTLSYNISNICALIDMNRRKIRDQQLACSAQDQNNNTNNNSNDLELIVQTQIEQLEEGKWNFSEVQAKLITFCRDYLSGRILVGQHFIKSLLSKNNSNGKEDENNAGTKQNKSKKNSKQNNNKKGTTNQNANPIDFYLKKETWQSVTCNVVSLATSLVPLLASESAFTTKRKLVDAILAQLPLKGTDESEKKIVYHRLIDWIMEYNNDYLKMKKNDGDGDDEKLLMMLKDGGILGEDSDNVETVVDAIKFGVSARKRTEKMKLFLVANE